MAKVKILVFLGCAQRGTTISVERLKFQNVLKETQNIIIKCNIWTLSESRFKPTNYKKNWENLNMVLILGAITFQVVRWAKWYGDQLKTVLYSLEMSVFMREMCKR